jgi:hypothetical protein
MLPLVRRFTVSRELLGDTEGALRHAGRNGDELFVLWSGTQDGETFHVRSAHVPRQTAHRSRKGVCVTVNGPELHKLNLWLFEAHETLAVQIHTHPEDAYHSETDDEFPIVTTLGGASIVVPRFAEDGVTAADTAVFRLTADGWIRTSAGLGELLAIS